MSRATSSRNATPSASGRWRRGLILPLMLVGALAGDVDAATWFVRKSGDDRRSGTKPNQAWASLRHAAKKAKPGDVIYVGGGAYLERIHFRRPGTGSSRPLRIIADTNGHMTGDRGPVYLLAPPRRWLLVSDLKSPLSFEGFVFTSVAKNNQGYGLYGRGPAASLVLSDCRFHSLRYGVYSNHRRIQVSSCRFAPFDSTAIYVRRGQAVIDDTVITGSRKKGYAVRVEKNTSAAITNLQTSGQKFGVYSRSAARLTVSKSHFNKCSYGVYGSTRRGDVNSCTVTGARGAVYLRGIDEAVAVSKSTFDGCSHGLMVPQPGYRASELTIRNCGFAVWLARQVQSFRLSASSGIQLSGNRYGVYVSPKGSPRVELRGIDFAGTTHTGVLAYDSHLTIRDCRFQGSRRGVQSIRSRSLTVRNSKFERMKNWGLVSSGSRLSISDSLFRRNTHGVHLSPSAGSAPELKRLTIEDGGYGLYVQNGTLRLGARDAITLRNNRYGLALRNVQSTLNRLTVSGGSYPLYLIGGRHELTNVSVANAAGHGILASQFGSFTADGLAVSGCRRWGLYLRGKGISIHGANVTKNGNGVYIQAKDPSRQFALSRSWIESNRSYGVLMAESQIASAKKLQLTIVNNGGIGLGAIGRSVTLDGGMGVTISGNRYGVYANKAGVDLTGVALANNRYGVRVIGGTAICRDCSISGGTTAVSSTNSPVVRITGGSISGTTSYGLSLANATAPQQQVELTQVAFRRCRTGAYVRTRPDATIAVTDCRMMSHRQHGLVSVNGTCSVRKSTFEKNGHYGLLHYDGLLSVTDSAFRGNGRYALRSLASKRPADTKLVARRVTASGNRYGIGAWKGSRAEIVNNIVTGNRYGILTRMTSGQAEIWNNTLVDNHVGVHHSGGKALLANSIISYGDRTDGVQNVYGIYRTAGTLDHRHNLLFGQRRKYIGTKQGPGDVIKPPRFRDHGKGDYRLAMGSPAINAGTRSTLATTDLIGTKRPMYKAFEIGAYEFKEKAGSVRILDWKETAAPRRGRR